MTYQVGTTITFKKIMVRSGGKYAKRMIATVIN